MLISISFAGNRNLTNQENLNDAFQNFFSNIESTFDRHYAEAKKKLAHTQTHNHNHAELQINLLNGLADGADMECADAFISWKPAYGSAKSLTGVFPFPIKDYLLTIGDDERFERLASQCNTVIILDGRYVPDDIDKDKDIAANEIRARGFRQQADYLLTACDLLLAAADPSIPGKAGGTLETVEKAKAQGVPVAFLDLSNMKLEMPDENIFDLYF